MHTASATHGPGSEHFHGVRFYQDDISLCRIVAAFIGDGLAASQPAVVIASPSHRAGILDELRSLSFDGGRLESTGELQVLDVEHALAAFMRHGSPDPVAFGATVGAVLQRARSVRPDATVRAYGEMVDWLWRCDETDAAMRLEVLWNDLANSYPFSLLCGYSMDNSYQQGAYEQICHQHTHVVSASGQHALVDIV
jgi:hypothetical protein